MTALPASAEIVIIGGGVVGCSVAYHLTQMGKRDVVLVEQGRLSCGTTWHAAGLVGQLRAHQNMTRLVQHSIELYARLEAETGLATGWKQCGSIIVARTPERMTLLRRVAASATAQGVPCDVISVEAAAERYPIMATHDLLGALWLPSDGKANPADVTQALAKGARMRGAKIFEKTKVTGIRVKDGRVTGVETAEGAIEAGVVVNCAGQWAKAVGRMCGVTVPLHSAEHMYIVTDQIPGVHPDLPVMRDPDGYIYVKEEVGGLLVGGFEPVAKPWATDGIPEPFEFQLLPDDWDQFQILMENALTRLPALHTAEIKSFVNGPESFTPDNNFIIGEAPELKSFYVAAGFNSIGIASGGGAGRALAEWIVGGEPSIDLWPVDIRRFARFNGNDTWLRSRVGEVLGLHYMMPWPNRELEFGAPVPALAALRPARGERRRVRVEDGLGTAELLRPQRGRAHDRLFLRAPELVRHRRGRAARRTPGRRGLRHDLVREAPGAGPRRRERAAAACRERRRGGGRRERLHRAPQRARHLRERRHDRAARAGPLPDRHRHGAGGPRRRLDRAPHPRGRARDAHRRDLGLCGDRGDGAAVARAPVPGEPRRLRQRRVSVRGNPRDRHRLCDARSPRAAPMSASSAGSSTCRPNLPRRCTTR